MTPNEQQHTSRGDLPSGLRRRKNNTASHGEKDPPPLTTKDTPNTTDTQHENINNENVTSPEEKSNYVDSLMGGAMRPSADAKTHQNAISTIDKHFRYMAIWNICTYITLVIIVYLVVPSEHIVRLEGTEQNSAILAACLIAVSFLSRVIPLMGDIGGTRKNNNNNKGIKKKKKKQYHALSGIFIGGLTVQIVAFTTDFLLAYFPTPTVLDPVLGTRVHVLRWCEWCPCAAYMTFMVEGADLYWKGETPPTDYLLSKYIHASTQGGAVFLGLLFPFCPGYKSWMVCMILSCCLYLTNYPRMRNRTRDIPKTLPDGATVEEAERYNSAKIALKLRYVTTAVWSIIVGLFFVSSVFGPKYAPEGSVLRSSAANMACECFFDVLSKVLFLVVIVDVHYAIFDPFARTERRLEELHQLMAAVWESSSDVIAISVRAGSNGGASTMLSPAFFGLGSSDGPLRNLSKEQVKDLFQRKSILYQLSSEAFQAKRGEDEDTKNPLTTPEMITSVEETGFECSIMELQTGKLLFDGEGVTPETGALRAVSDAVIKAWTCDDREVVFPFDLQWTSNRSDRENLVRTEAKVSRLDHNALILIVRDISERVRVFEAEKQVSILYIGIARPLYVSANSSPLTFIFFRFSMKQHLDKKMQKRIVLLGMK